MAALLYRKVVEDAIVACLSAGFNSAVAEFSGIYNVPAFDLDFSEDSKSVVFGKLDVADIDLTSLIDFPGAFIYTDTAENGTPRLIHGVRFSGEVNAGVTVVLRSHGGREDIMLHRTLAMADDAIAGLFAAYTWPVDSAASVTYSRRFRSEIQRSIPLADGYCQSVNIEAFFLVTIP